MSQRLLLLIPVFLTAFSAKRCVQSAVCISSKSSDTEDEHWHGSKATVLCYYVAWWTQNSANQCVAPNQVYTYAVVLPPRQEWREMRWQIEAEPRDLVRSGNSHQCLSEFRGYVPVGQHDHWPCVTVLQVHCLSCIHAGEVNWKLWFIDAQLYDWVQDRRRLKMVGQICQCGFWIMPCSKNDNGAACVGY